MGRSRKKRVAFLCALACVGGMAIVAPISAQAEEHTVYVKAEREQELLKEDPTTKIIITRAELDRKGARTLADALAAVQDVHMGVDNMGRATVSIRGAEPRHTLILIDGRRLTSGISKFNGAVDEIQRVSVDSIHHVEIIRGAASTKYGADAMGGVINVVTKVADKPSVYTNLERSFLHQDGSQYNHQISVSTGKRGKVSAEFTYGENKTAPFKYNDDTASMRYYGKRRPMGAKLQVDLGKNQSLLLSADRLEESLEKHTPSGSVMLLDANEEAWRNNFSIQWQKQTEKFDYKIRAYQSEYQSDVNFLVRPKPTSNIPYKYPYFDTVNHKDRIIEASIGMAINDKHMVTVGGEYHEESGEGTRIFVPGQKGKQLSKIYRFPNKTDPSNPTVLSWEGTSYDTEMSHYSVYVEDEWQFKENWLLTPAIRYDNSSKFSSRLSPKIGVTYKAKPNLRFKMNVGTGFSMPGIAELYHDWEMYEPSVSPRPPFRNGWYFKGNPDLKPEKSLNIDVSVEMERGKTAGKLTFFRNSFRDFMQIVYDGEQPSKNLNGFTHFDPNVRFFDPYYGWDGYTSYEEVLQALKGASTFAEKKTIAFDNLDYVKGVPAMDDIYTYKNIARAQMQGIELEMRHQFSPKFSVKAGYTLLDARDSNTDARLEGRGRNLFNLSLNYNNQARGLRATFWGDYTQGFLDIRDRELTGRIIKNESAGGTGEYYSFVDSKTGKTIYTFPDRASAEDFANVKNKEHSYTREKKAKEKDYGVWNFMIEKDMGKEMTAYVGVTNIFNTEDEFLGLGGRIYRTGLRMKF